MPLTVGAAAILAAYAFVRVMRTPIVCPAFFRKSSSSERNSVMIAFDKFSPNVASIVLMCRPSFPCVKLYLTPNRARYESWKCLISSVCSLKQYLLLQAKALARDCVKICHYLLKY